MNKEQIDDIIRAYFDARIAVINGETDGKEYEDNHKIVVDILKHIPEYANYYLTSEERHGDD